MRLSNCRILRGPNQYSYCPVIVVRLDLGQLADLSTEKLPEFISRLVAAFPSLSEHGCSLGRKGGFLERLEEGTYLGHVLEHLALELQNLCGEEVNYGQTRHLEGSCYRLVCEYRTEKLGVRAVKYALQIILGLLEGQSIEPQRYLSELNRIKQEESLGPSTRELVCAAKNRGLPVKVLDASKSLIQVGYGSSACRLAATITENTSCLAVDIASDKWQTKEILRQMQLPVPQGWIVTSYQEALERMQQLGPSVVVKPYNRNQGKGVTTNLSSKNKLRKAVEIAQQYSTKVIVEESIPGRDYRLLVVGDEVVAAAERLPPRVTGDGERKLWELIEKENQNPRRGYDHEKPLTKIPIDPSLILHLSRQGLNLESVLPPGKEVELRGTGNLSCGGRAIDVTHQLHPQNIRLALAARDYIGLDVAGIDLITPDISSPAVEEGGAIIEVNAAPGLRMHHFPSQGKARDAAGKIIEMLFPPSREKVPVIAVTGTNGKTTIARLISYLLQRSGSSVGTATTDGIYLNGRLLHEGDMTGPWSAGFVLRHPRVEAAVLETARGGMLREGLGFDSCQLGIVSNISPDHLGQEGINDLQSLARLKSLVLEVVERDGYSVINADDPYVLEMVDVAGGELVYISQQEDNPALKKHLARGGRAVYLDKKGIIILGMGKERYPLLSVDRVPFTLGGKAVHQVENMLLAIAASRALGLSPQLIRSALQEFGLSPDHNPGRLTIIEEYGIRVIVDYGHNLEGYRQTLATARRIGSGRLLGVIGLPNDREAESIRRVGQLAGESFQVLYIKEDKELRGRKRGEVARLLAEGVNRAQNPGSYSLLLQEEEAVMKALSEARAGDTVIVFYERNPEGMIDYIREGIKGLKRPEPVCYNLE